MIEELKNRLLDLKNTLSRMGYVDTTVTSYSAGKYKQLNNEIGFLESLLKLYQIK